MDSCLSVKNRYECNFLGESGHFVWVDRYLWMCIPERGMIYKTTLKENILSILAEYKSPSRSPTGLAWDGKNLWSCDANSHKIYKHNMDDTLSVAEEHDAPSNIPVGLAWDGEHLWSGNGGVFLDYSYSPGQVKQGTLEIYKHNMDATLSVVATYHPKFGLDSLTGLTWDGESIWICGEGPNTRAIIKTDYK